MSSAATPRLVRYNVRWGNKSNQSSMNVSDIMATYKKKLRAVLWKNKYLARALGASKKKVSDLEKASNRQQKVYNLALPQIKTWLEMGIKHARNMCDYQSRAVSLLQEIMTTDVDFTLARVSDDGDDDTNIEDGRPSLHPPGSRWLDHLADFSLIPEDDEDVDVSRRTLLDEIVLRAAVATACISRGSSLNKKSPLPAAGHPLIDVSRDEAMLRKSHGSRRSSERASPVCAPSSPSAMLQAPTQKAVNANITRGSSLVRRRSSLSAADRDGCELDANDSLKSTGLNTKRSRRTDIGPRFTDCAFCESPSLTAPLCQASIPGDKMVDGGAQNYIREEAETPHLKISSAKPSTLTSSAELKIEGRKSSAPNKGKDATDRPESDVLGTVDPFVAISAGALYGVGRGPGPEPEERSTGLYTLQATGRNARRGMQVEVTPRAFEFFSPESTSLTATVPEVPSLASAETVTNVCARKCSSQEDMTMPLNSPEVPSASDAEKERQASFVRSEGNDLAEATGLGSVVPAAPSATNTESLTGVDRGRSRPNELQPPKKSSRRATRRETVEDGATTSTGGERVTRSASGRPVRSSTLGKSYKEPNIGKKLRRP